MKRYLSRPRRPAYLCYRFAVNLPIMVSYKLRFLRAIAANGLRVPLIIFYPDLPLPDHMIYKVCHLLGYRMTKRASARAVLVVHFEDATRKRDSQALRQLAAVHSTVLNLRCMDISKSTVDSVFAKVFGYSLSIDPLTHKGPCFRKSEINARHDGKIVNGPLTPEPGFVYQKFIDTRGEDGFSLDMRVPVVGDTVPFVRLRHRDPGQLYGSFARQTMVETAEVLSAGEEGNILAFCREMGVDYAELDVLRDREDGRIYVMDVNDTPYARTRSIIERTAGAFEGFVSTRLLNRDPSPQP